MLKYSKKLFKSFVLKRTRTIFWQFGKQNNFVWLKTEIDEKGKLLKPADIKMQPLKQETSEEGEETEASASRDSDPHIVYLAHVSPAHLTGNIWLCHQ